MVKLPTGKSYLDPAFLLEKLDVSPGMKMADFGCGGSGYFTLQAAEMVGSKGKVFAIDIFKPCLSSIWRNVKLRGYDDVVRCVWSDLEIYEAAKKIKDETLDRGILANVLHQSKKQKNILKECARMLKKEGRLLVIDWKTSGLVFGPQEKDLVPPEKVKKMAASAGLAEMDNFKAGSYHYGLIFVKIS